MIISTPWWAWQRIFSLGVAPVEAGPVYLLGGL